MVDIRTKFEISRSEKILLETIQQLRNELSVTKGMLNMAELTTGALNLILARRDERIKELERELLRSPELTRIGLCTCEYEAHKANKNTG